MYPEAPIYTSLYQPEALPAAYRDWDVRPSLLNRFPSLRQHHQWCLPLYPYVFEHLDLSGYDLVLSVTSAFAHGVITGPQTLHICYCLTPARFLWDHRAYEERERINRVVRLVLPLLIHRLQLWDRLAAGRVDHFVAISKAVQGRIAKFYHREAEVIYPPVDAQRWQQLPLIAKEGYFLVVSRLVPYKRIDLAVKAFTELGLPLWIVGDGRDRAPLEAMAGPGVRFLGHVSDEALGRYLMGCRAFVFPGEEDFGIAPLEAQAAGRPVIAYAGGGALETVREGTTGLFFRQPTSESLAEAVRRFDDMCFDPAAIRQHALGFDRSLFQRQFADFVQARCAELADRSALGERSPRRGAA